MIIECIEMNAMQGDLIKLVAVVHGNKSDVAEKIRLSNEKPYDLELKPHRKKRSLDANAYYWVLIEKLAQILGVPVHTMHEMLLMDYGTLKRREDGSLMAFSLLADIDPHEVCKYPRRIGSADLNGKEFIHYAVVKGSSEMDSKEFSILLDGCISECKAVGVEVLSEDEIKRMKGALECA